MCTGTRIRGKEEGRRRRGRGGGGGGGGGGGDGEGEEGMGRGRRGWGGGGGMGRGGGGGGGGEGEEEEEEEEGSRLTLLASAMMTFPRLLKLLLIHLVSLSLSPSEPELVRRSEPARSIRLSVAACVRGEGPRGGACLKAYGTTKDHICQGTHTPRHTHTPHMALSPSHSSPVLLFEPDILSLKRLWLLEDRSLQSVAATARALAALQRRSATWEQHPKE